MYSTANMVVMFLLRRSTHHSPNIFYLIAYRLHFIDVMCVCALLSPSPSLSLSGRTFINGIDLRPYYVLGKDVHLFMFIGSSYRNYFPCTVSNPIVCKHFT